MAEPIDEIGAAIPFGALPRISAVWRVVEIEQVPERDDPALVQREGQRVCRRPLRHQCPRHHKGIERMQVVVRDAHVMGIRKSRVEMTPVARDAVAHRAVECLFRPVADTGLGIGRDVRAVDGAERGRDRPAASIGGPTRHSVTDIAIADRGELGALLD